MLVVVKKPHIEIRTKRMPVGLMRFIRSAYKPENIEVKKTDDEELVPYRETAFHRNVSVKLTPGRAIKEARDHFGWTQATLAEKLGVAVQNVSEMERGKRTVSKKMAVVLGKVFGLGPSMFFEFPENI